ncbi:sigma 54-interacting transcriptional regulator, partial [Salmonella enterica subsp. enterica serovar Montevideo]|nr:sigma 54-interacting transcriptional regulator [Salmonella enterica subsp. enterica serovar Montevideo]
KGRAAVLYPHGLHVLLTGPSGVGKTFFAELMHRFACEQASGAPRSGSRVRVSFPAPILIYSKIIHNEYRVGARFVPLSSDPCKQ